MNLTSDLPTRLKRYFYIVQYKILLTYDRISVRHIPALPIAAISLPVTLLTE